MEKAPDAFRTISEVADNLDVPQHVLRFWETRFAQIKPMKRSGGRRYYRREDVELLRGIRHLLYGEGYTIRGVQRILREQGVKAVQGWDVGSIAGSGQADAGPADIGPPDAELHDEGSAFEPDGHGAGRNGADRNGAVASVSEREAADEDEDGDAGDDATVARAPREQAARQAAAPEVIIVNRINAENVTLLRGALDELAECRRLLDGSAGRG